MVCASAWLLGRGGVVFGLLVLELLDSTNCFRGIAVVMGVKIQVLVKVFFILVLVGFEKDVVVVVTGGVGEVWIDGGIGGGEGW